MGHEETTSNRGMDSLAKKKGEKMDVIKQAETTNSGASVDAPSDAPETVDGVDSTDPVPELLELGSREEDPLQEMLASTEARLKTVSAAYVELQREMTEMKDRIGRQRRVEKELMKGEVVRSIFEPLQNLRRSVEALGGTDIDSDLASGLDMVVREFLAGFESLGLEEVPGVGAVFNPDLHEALSVLPVTEPDQDGKILEVFSAGYRVGGTLLSPGKVIIGKFEEPVGDA